MTVSCLHSEFLGALDRVLRFFLRLRIPCIGFRRPFTLSIAFTACTMLFSEE
jgi:hypothetical protein